MSAVELLLPPFVACLILVAIHSYLGLHVIAREVIFVDLSLAQMAALGSLLALAWHMTEDSWQAYSVSLGFTAVGAFVFAMTRTTGRGAVPQEAIIGIIFVVASAAGILVASGIPSGGEAIKKTLEGRDVVLITWPSIGRLAVAYSIIGIIHYALRRRFLTISFHPEEAERAGWKMRWWDFWFYLSFGIVITFSVPVVGVLMVFTFLVVPAVIAFLFTRDLRKLTYIAWASGAVASSLGLWVSYEWDKPMGPVIVCAYGVLLAAAGVLRKLRVGDKAVGV
jgi:zinc/manganese transport system permease protein